MFLAFCLNMNNHQTSTPNQSPSRKRLSATLRPARKTDGMSTIEAVWAIPETELRRDSFLDVAFLRGWNTCTASFNKALRGTGAQPLKRIKTATYTRAILPESSLCFSTTKPLVKPTLFKIPRDKERMPSPPFTPVGVSSSREVRPQSNVECFPSSSAGRGRVLTARVTLVFLQPEIQHTFLWD